MYGDDFATVHLHGEATAIHSNGQVGIYADGSGKVLIHLPSHHNTSYNNGETFVCGSKKNCVSTYRSKQFRIILSFLKFTRMFLQL